MVMGKVRVQELIIENAGWNRGRGTEHDCFRCVTRFWTKGGDLLGEVDPVAPVYDPVDGAWMIRAWMKTKPYSEEVGEVKEQADGADENDTRQQ